VRYQCVSGGADSVAMALLAHERGEDFEIVFSDSGAELPEVYWLLHRLADYVGKPLNVTANNTFLFWLTQMNYLLPTPMKRWCTGQLKTIPQARFFKSVDAESIAIGIRADEQQRLRLGTGDSWTIAYPLNEAGMGKADVLELCRKHDMLSPVYDWRSATSCFCCPFQRVGDWRGLLTHHPMLYMAAEEWERQAIKRMGLYAGYFSGKLTLSDLRHAKNAECELFPEPDAEPCSICAH